MPHSMVIRTCGKPSIQYNMSGRNGAHFLLRNIFELRSETGWACVARQRLEGCELLLIRIRKLKQQPNIGRNNIFKQYNIIYYLNKITFKTIYKKKCFFDRKYKQKLVVCEFCPFKN